MQENNMAVLAEKKLADGRHLRILRFISPQETVPENVIRYLIGSIGFDSYNKYIIPQAYWRSFYRESFEGKLTGITSYLYLAEVNGVFAARLWFAYADHSGFGNFGNVYTESDFRRLGLMSELMKPCMADFDTADAARILCCASGNLFAVQSYLKHGFRLTYGGETGPLERTRRPGDTLFSIENELFQDTRLAAIRDGRPDDQFVTDKFIAHTEPVWFRLHARRGPSEYIPNFQTARLEASLGNGTVQTACNAAGTVTGYASAIVRGGSGILDFTAHERSFPDVPELLKATAEIFHARFDMDLFFYAFPGDTEKIQAIRSAGAELAGKTQQMEIWYL